MFPNLTASWMKAKSYIIPKVEFNASHRSPNDRVLTILSRYFLTAGSKMMVLYSYYKCDC
jgi:hypothetical protein